MRLSFYYRSCGCWFVVTGRLTRKGRQAYVQQHLHSEQSRVVRVLGRAEARARSVWVRSFPVSYSSSSSSLFSLFVLLSSPFVLFFELRWKTILTYRQISSVKVSAVSAGGVETVMYKGQSVTIQPSASLPSPSLLLFPSLILTIDSNPA